MSLDTASFVLGGVCSAAAAVVIHRLLGPGESEKSEHPPVTAPVPVTAPPAAVQSSAAEPQTPATPGRAGRRLSADRRLSTEFLLDQPGLEPSDTMIIVGYQLPIIVSRATSGGFTVEWDHERGLNKAGMNLPTRLIYVGCIAIDVSPDEGEPTP